MTSERVRPKSAAKTASGASRSRPTSEAATSAHSSTRHEQRVDARVTLPPGYRLDWGGTFEQSRKRPSSG